MKIDAMTWPEVRLAKHLAEKKIGEAIQELHDNTGLVIINTYLSSDEITTTSDEVKRFLYTVELDCRV